MAGVSLRPGSLTKPSRKTCPSLQVLKNRTRRRSIGIPRKIEVRQITTLLPSHRNPLSIPETSSAVMKTSLSMDSSDQKKTKTKLKKFLIRRPTYQAVRDKGYIKGSAQPPPPCCRSLVHPPFRGFGSNLCFS